MSDTGQSISSQLSLDELMAQYRRLQSYVGWTEEDPRRLRSLRGVAERLLPELVDDFYREIQNHPEALRVITGGPEQIARLKRTLKLWLRELFSGVYDAQYVSRHWQAGLRHVEIGLPSVYTHVALARLRQGLLTGLQEAWPGDSVELLESLPALNRLLDLDLAIIDCAYQAETVARERRAERLAEVAEFGRRAFLDDQVERLICKACRRAALALHGDVGSAWELSPVGDQFVARCIERMSDQMPPSAQAGNVGSVTSDASTCPGFAVRASTALAVADFASKPRFQANSFQLEMESRACLCVAIPGSLRPFGVLQIDFRRPKSFSESDSTFLQSIANVLGAVLSRQQMEERTRQTERLAAIGQMVTGLVHESRNALQRSQACLEMLTFEVAGQERAIDLIDRILTAQKHLHHLFEEVRGYAAPISVKRVPCDLRAIWRATWSHLESNRQGKSIHLVEMVTSEHTDCVADPNSLEQVFRNVFDNAIHACPEVGRVTISCELLNVLEVPTYRIRIRDNGPGLSLDQHYRLFEPFFTTKTHGTGLGMPIARRIMQAHGGSITATERFEPGSGAEFVVTLPHGSESISLS